MNDIYFRWIAAMMYSEMTRLSRINKFKHKYAEYSNVNIRKRFHKGVAEYYRVIWQNGRAKQLYLNKNQKHFYYGAVNYRFGVVMEKILKSNIKLLKELIDGYQPHDAITMLKLLPATYRELTDEIKGWYQEVDKEKWIAERLTLPKTGSSCCPSNHLNF